MDTFKSPRLVAATVALAAACKPDCPSSEGAKPEPGIPTAVTRQQNYVITSGSTELEVDPLDGARIVALRLAGKNILIERDETPDAFGSSFWLSPQSEWGWPPPKEIATGRYGVRTEGDTLVLESKTYPKLDISVTKRIRKDDKCDCFVLRYTLQNHGALPRKTAPWQNSRVRPGGLTFYPTGAPPLAASTLKLDAFGEVTFYKHDKAANPSGGKSFADGREGWLAHTDGELLFIKSFPDVPDGQQAPGEGEIELYVDGGGRFVEIEQQGPYVEIPPGGNFEWTVRWFLRRIPAGLDASPGSRAVVELVRATLKEAKR
jgi:hypothetical protein